MSLPPRGPACRPGPRVPGITQERHFGEHLAGRLTPVVWVAAVAAALSVLAACSRGPAAKSSTLRPSSVSQRSTNTARATAYPGTVSFRDGPLPELSYREFELPPGANVTDHTERLAAYAQNGPEYWHPVFGLLDLRSGESRIAVRRGVNEARGFSPLTPKISDSWMVWEELSPDEEASPEDSQWYLYAAPIDIDKLAVGKPILVDQGVTNYKRRPHYVVLGSTAFWSVNMKPGPHQEDFPRSGSIRTVDLSTGRRGVLHGTSTSYPTLCATDGMLSATEIVSAASVDRARALLIDPADGELVLSRELNNTWRLSHFVRASREWLAWAAEPAEGAEWPTLYVARRDESVSRATDVGTGDVLMAGINSTDPVFFGRYMAFESVTASSAGSMGGITRRARRIWIADPERRTRSVLLETRDDMTGGWWQTCASGRRTRVLLLWNDLGPWSEDQAHARTVVRLYTPTR